MKHDRLTTIRLARSSDAGMATAEYAVGTVGAACIACILLRLADDGTIFEIIQAILRRIMVLPDLMPDKFQRLM